MSSRPSTVCAARATSAPALWISTSTAARTDAPSSAAEVRTASRTARSATTVVTRGIGRDVQRSTAGPHRCAPGRARRAQLGAALRESRRRREAEPAGRAGDRRRRGRSDRHAGSSSQPKSARRAAKPMRLKLPTTVSSSAASATHREPRCGRSCAHRPSAGVRAARPRRGRRCGGRRARAAGRPAGPGPWLEARVVGDHGRAAVDRARERDRVDGADEAVLGSQHDPLVAARTRRSRTRAGRAGPRNRATSANREPTPDRLGREHRRRRRRRDPTRRRGRSD